MAPAAGPPYAALQSAHYLGVMFSAEFVLNAMAAVALMLGMVWVFLTIHVLYFSEKKHDVVPFWIQFWPFLANMRELYPSSSRVGRLLTIWAGIFALPWVVGRFMGYC